MAMKVSETELQRRFSRWSLTRGCLKVFKESGISGAAMFELKSSRGKDAVSYSEIKDHQWVELLRGSKRYDELRLLKKKCHPSGHKISDMSINQKPCDFVWFVSAHGLFVFGFPDKGSDRFDSYVVDVADAFKERFDESGIKKSRGSFTRDWCRDNCLFVVSL